MNSELNNYNINNPDGAGKIKLNEGKNYFDNDNLDYIKEDFTSNIKETSKISETSDGRTQNSDRKASSSVSETSGNDVKSVSSSVSSASTAASATSALGGSVGALAGTVAASAMAAVIVVAAFVSTLVINLSLAMAGMYSLVFEIDMTGAQEEDFVNPIVAVLEGNGVYSVQEVYPDTRYITFEDLEPGTEYIITIKNEEKVFVKKSYCTATEQVLRGSMSVALDGDDVFIRVEEVNLKSGEFYTVTAKDDKGEILFIKDDVDPNKEFSFKLSEPKNLCFALSIGGTTYCMDYIQTEPEYDFDKPVWTWEEDFSAATLSFREIHGGEPLVYKAEVSKETIDPSCEIAGMITYTATYDDYTDIKTETISALGHDYGEPEFFWMDNEPYGGYKVEIIRTCSRDGIQSEFTADRWEVDWTRDAGLPTRTVFYVAEYGEYTSTLTGTILEGSAQNLMFITDSGYKKSPNVEEEIVDNSKHNYFFKGMAESCENIIEISNESDDAKDYHFIFSNLRIWAAEEAALFRIIAKADMNIYITVYGEVSLTTFNQFVFDISNSDSDSVSNVKFYVDVKENASFRFDENLLFGTEDNLNVEFYVNGQNIFIKPVELSLNDGFIGIDPTGYARSHNDSTLIGATSYVSSESGPYIISGTIYADDSLDVYNMTGTKKTIYLRFNDVYIQSGMWATAFRIIANADLDIYIVNEGSTTIKAGNHYGIEVQGDTTVNIYVTGSESFNLSGDNGPFGVPPDRSGTCNLYMNGVKQ